MTRQERRTLRRARALWAKQNRRWRRWKRNYLAFLKQLKEDGFFDRAEAQA